MLHHEMWKSFFDMEMLWPIHLRNLMESRNFSVTYGKFLGILLVSSLAILLYFHYTARLDEVHIYGMVAEELLGKIFTPLFKKPENGTQNSILFMTGKLGVLSFEQR